MRDTGRVASRRGRRWVVLAATCIAVVAAVETLAAGCSVADLDETGKSCTGDRCPSGLPCVQGRCGVAPGDAGDAGSDAAVTCTPPEGGNPCTTIPRLNGVQTVDCVPAEFCDVPVWTLAAPSGGASPAAVRLQVAWSDAGLHAFVSVRKWPVFPVTTTDLYDGDAIELFVAASSASLLGQQDDDSIHFVGAPPPQGTPGGEAIFFQPNEGPMEYVAPDGISAGCLVPDAGYDLEIQMPWSLPWLPQTAPPAAGATIGFDFAADVKPVTGSRVQTFEVVSPTPDAGAANQCAVNGLAEAPYCDDRCFCRPTVR
jgi:hypothetical protein